MIIAGDGLFFLKKNGRFSEFRIFNQISHCDWGAEMEVALGMKRSLIGWTQWLFYWYFTLLRIRWSTSQASMLKNYLKQ